MDDFLNIDLSEALVSEELPTIGENERFYLHQLADKTTLDEVQKGDINAQIDECFTLADYEELSHYLYLNRIDDRDRIAMGLPYNQSDIKKALRKDLGVFVMIAQYDEGAVIVS